MKLTVILSAMMAALASAAAATDTVTVTVTAPAPAESETQGHGGEDCIVSAPPGLLTLTLFSGKRTREEEREILTRLCAGRRRDV